jgi:hypothetical protein
VDTNSLTTPTTPRWLSGVLYVGPVALFLAATAYGILEVHSSTDTWIGLAAGRQILTADEFPKTDTFSYTFYGKVWYNQNWLTHLCQYWLYSRISPNAVAFGTWTLSASVFFLTLLAAYWRSGTWLGALLAASVVGLGCRDFLSARPATTGFFCIASLWALLCALEGQRSKHRWWPIVLLLPLLLFWGNAHGSFVFGYGVLGLYVGHWFVVRTIRVRHSWSFSLVLVLLLLLIGGLLYSTVPAGVGVKAEEVWTLFGRVCYREKLRLLVVALVAYGAYWACIRIFRPRLAIGDRQIAAIGTVVVAALLLTVTIGPFGIHNFTHGQKVAGSKVFRQVSEWNPPFEKDAAGQSTYTPDLTKRHFPPMWRFWYVFRASIGVLALCAILWAITRRLAPRSAEAPRRPHTSLFDVAVVTIGLSMTFWARRFAPIFFIFGAPVFLAWIVPLLRPLLAALRGLWPPFPPVLRGVVAVGAGGLAVVVAHGTYTRADNEIVWRLEAHPQFNLLEAVTCYDITPHAAIMFLKHNNLNVNLVVEWTQAGPVMFHAPNAKVFMDGRAQQVYNEEHYRKYYNLLTAANTPRNVVAKCLDEHGTDAVLLRRRSRVQNLWMTLQQSQQWVLALTSMHNGLFIRKDSPALAQLGELLRRGEEWRPNLPGAIAARGFVWQALTPPDLEQAMACWRAALDQNVLLGSICFRPLTRTLLELGRKPEARQVVEGYYRQLNRRVPGLPEASRHELLNQLKECWNEIENAAPAGQGADAGQ